MRHWAKLITIGLLAMSVVALAGERRAQPAPQSPTAKSGTRLITLGTRSGPIPTVWRAQSSNLLIVNGTMYLIDAGEGVTRRLTRFGANFRNIGHIFITHPHSDHTGGLGGLMGTIFDANRTAPVHVYGPPGTAASVSGLIQFLTVSSDIRISDGGRVVPVSKVFTSEDSGTGIIFQDGNVKVTAVENSHFHFPSGSPGFGRYKSYSHRFDTGDRSVVFVGDTGPSDAVSTLAKGADVLVSEVNSVDEYKMRQMAIGRWQSMTPEQQAGSLRHMVEEHVTPEQVAQMASRAGVKTVVLTHLPATNDPKDEYQRFADTVKKGFSGDVKVAKDLSEF